MGSRSSSNAGRICVIGWGAIARQVYRLLSQHSDLRLEIVGVAVRHENSPRDLPAGARLMTKPDELKALRPDLVVEIAARSAVAPWAAGAFAVPCDFAVVSTAALGDPDLKSKLIKLAREAGRQLVVIPGALGGFDALRAAAIGGLEEVEHISTKPPRAWRGTPAEELVDLDACRKREVIFEGPAARAAELFPQNANVASTLQFVVGDAVRVKSTLLVDPDCEANEHHFKARGQLGEVEFKTISVPTPENPKSSIMTALSIVRTLENWFGPIAC